MKWAFQYNIWYTTSTRYTKLKMVFHFGTRLSTTKGGKEGRRRTVLIAVYQQQKNTNKNTIGSASAKRNKPRI